ncbi:hypothetical protein A9995_15595 [Erythrobacter sp. QSSC1-22B]|nr:hypothetical protein A9995_15595 [Erythrobacter sp. QSSC1-22B]
MWLEDVDELADQVPQAADGPLTHLAQHGFEPGEGLLDWIEVGGVGWKEALLALLVAGQINGTVPSNGGTDQRNVRFEQIAMHSSADMAEKWQAPIAFYE